MNSLAGRAPMNALAFELRAGRCEEAVQVASEELPAARRFPWIDYASTIALFKAYALTWLGRRDEAQIELRSLPPQTVVFVHDLAFSARDLAAGVIDPGRRPFA